MPSIFAVANPKGGSGKTTVAIILAGEFAKHGYSAAIIDADPQGSSYQWHASSVARGLSPQGVDLVRAPDEKALIAAVDKLQSYDVVVIDTPGYYGEVLVQSALRADLVVLPCKVHTFDASQVVRTILAADPGETGDYRLFYNVNFPACPAAQVAGIQVVPQGRRVGTKFTVQPHASPSGRRFLWVRGGDQRAPSTPGSDVAVNMEGYVSVTPMRADLTAHDALHALQSAFS